MFLIVSMKIHQGKYLLMKTLTFQVMIFRNCIQDQKVHLPFQDLGYLYLIHEHNQRVMKRKMKDI